jgi:uncharacterized protein (TIGR02246 family)
MANDDDEKAIRTLFADWARASEAGKIDDLLPLMSEDVIFLIAGGSMRGRAAFATNFESLIRTMRIESNGQIDELEISGDMAYIRTQLEVIITPLTGGPPKRRTGPTLTILRKQPNGTWAITRDANLLVADPEPTKAP